MRDRRSPVPRGRAGRPEAQCPDKHRARVDSNTLEDQCHPRKIFIGGLAHNTTTQHLRDHFGRFGPIVDAVVLRWPDGRSRGFGYVTFSDSNSAAGVLKETHSLSGREVDVKRAVPGTNKLFIGGLPQNTTANELREHFEKFGVVSDAVVMIDPATSRSRGFGFVCFLPGQEGATAVTSTLQQYENHRMRGKWIEVKSAAPPHKLAAQEKAGAQDGPPQSYEELALAGALPPSMNGTPLSGPAHSPSPSIENREPNQRTREPPALGSPRKVELPTSPTEMQLPACNNPVHPALPPPGLTAPMSTNEVGSWKVNEVQWSSQPWWSSRPYMHQQQFGPGYGLSRYANSAPVEDNTAPPIGAEYFRSPPYMDPTGLSVADTLQRNLEQFLRQSQWDTNKGTAAAPREPSVSTTCSTKTAATPTDIAQPTFLP